VGEVPKRPPNKRPPLDRGFFSVALKTNKADTTPIVDYLRMEYGRDFSLPVNDSLEAAMVLLYSITGDSRQERIAGTHLANLILLYAKRIATTTDNLKIHRRSKLYRLFIQALRAKIEPADLTLLTFNQDLHIEKTLLEIHRQHGSVLPLQSWFALPKMYCLPKPFPIRGRSSSDPLFPIIGHDDPCVAVLKLHGSFNWYSVHRSSRPNSDVLFNPGRRLYVSNSATTRAYFTVRHRKRTDHARPIIIPPVSHKSAILQKDVRELWAVADQRLRQATRIIVFGYSCPESDLESASLIGRCLNATRRSFALHIVDPNPATVSRFHDLTHCPRIHYYDSIDQFLSVGQSIFN